MSGTKITLCRYDIQYGCHCGQLENCVCACVYVFIYLGWHCSSELSEICVDYKVILLVQIYLNVDVVSSNMATILKIYFWFGSKTAQFALNIWSLGWSRLFQMVKSQRQIELPTYPSWKWIFGSWLQTLVGLSWQQNTFHTKQLRFVSTSDVRTLKKAGVTDMAHGKNRNRSPTCMLELFVW